MWRLSRQAFTPISLALLACGSSEDSHAKGGSPGSAGSSESAGSGGKASSGGSASSAGSAGTGGTPPTVDEFCERWINEFSTYMERCACDSATVLRYRETVATACEPSGFLVDLPAAVAAGDFTYDGHAAQALFQRLREPEPECLEEPFRALKLDSVELYSLGGVFLGTRSLGEPCEHPVGYKGGISDCREGACAWDGSEAGVCIALVGLGEECDASGDENFRSTVPRLCHLRRPPDADGEYESAFDSLMCDTSAGAPRPRCVNDLSDGSACRSSEVCRSGLCLRTGTSDDAVCAAKVVNGAPCQSHLECASGACQNGEPRVCGAPFADGEACQYADSACQSGSCSSNSAGVCVPPATLTPGESCTLSSECTTNGHGNSRNSTCQAGRCVADICAAHAE